MYGDSCRGRDRTLTSGGNRGGDDISRTVASFDWIVFDAVGTLIIPDPPVVDTYARVGRDHGSQLERVEIASRFKRLFEELFGSESSTVDGANPLASSEEIERVRWEELVARLFDDVDSRESGLFESLWEYFAKRASWRLFDDVEPTFRALRERGIRFAIGSNFDSRLVGLVSSSPVLSLASRVFHSSDIGWLKPSRGFFDTVAQRLNSVPTRLLMIGDHPTNDVLGSRNANWVSCHLKRQVDDSDCLAQSISETNYCESSLPLISSSISSLTELIRAPA